MYYYNHGKGELPESILLPVLNELIRDGIEVGAFTEVQTPHIVLCVLSLAIRFEPDSASFISLVLSVSSPIVNCPYHYGWIKFIT